MNSFRLAYSSSVFMLYCTTLMGWEKEKNNTTPHPLKLHIFNRFQKTKITGYLDTCQMFGPLTMSPPILDTCALVFVLFFFNLISNHTGHLMVDIWLTCWSPGRWISLGMINLGPVSPAKPHLQSMVTRLFI